MGNNGLQEDRQPTTTSRRIVAENSNGPRHTHTVPVQIRPMPRNTPLARARSALSQCSTHKSPTPPLAMGPSRSEWATRGAGEFPQGCPLLTHTT